MRRLMTIAVCAAVLGACGGSSDTAATPTDATIATGATDTTAASPTTSTVAPTTVAPAPVTTEAATTVAPDPTTTTSVPVAGLTAIAIETAAEQAALATAASPAGRAWALGNAVGTDQAVGDPFLVGYEVRLDDGVTQHQVLVLNGVVVSFFGATSGMLDIPGDIADMWKTTAPETPRQQAAVDAARASLAATAPGAGNGGILAYCFAFPSTESINGGSQYPSVAVFAIAPDPTALFASGGPEIR